MDIIYVIINATFYLSLVAYYLWRKGLNLNTIPLLLWGVSSLASIYFYVSEYRMHSYVNEITLLPFIYLFVLVWLSFLPLLQYDYRQIKVINVNSTVFNCIACFISFLSVFTFYPNLRYFLSNMFVPEAYLNQYIDKMNGVELKVLYGVADKIMLYCKYFKGIIPVFLILSFTPFVRTHRIIRLGLLFSLLNLFLNYMNTASRFALLTDLFLMYFIYLFLYPFFKENMKQIVKKIALILCGVLASIVFLISIQRFGNKEDSSNALFFSIALYAGESFVNFNGDMWGMPKYTNGENCFAYFKYKLNGEKDCVRDYIKLERKVHRRMNVFYTFIGDYYTDWGGIWTIIIVVVLSACLCVYLRPHHSVGLGSIIVLFTYVKVLLLGFTYWTYLNYTMEVVVNLSVAFFFSLTMIKRKK